MSQIIISADSHVLEAPNTYTDYIEPAFRDRAPRVAVIEEGLVFDIEGMAPLRMSFCSAAGLSQAERRRTIRSYSELHQGGWDPLARLADQDRDGVSAEVVYPTVGMMICNHPDAAYKDACFKAYNRWVAEYSAAAPERILGIGQTAMRSPAEGVADLKAIKAAGLRGVMMPGVPELEDYDSPIYDEFWQAAVDLALPVGFHIIATGGFDLSKVRGTKMNAFNSTLRGVQDVLGMIVFGGVFERNPDLKLVCVEGDAGWTPHYAYRMNRAYSDHRHILTDQKDLSKKPSEYFFENIYFTFQDDPFAFQFADSLNWRRLMWANDFPHSDSTWPNSQALLAKQSTCVAPEKRQAILCQNAADLYGVDLARLERALAA